MVPVPDFQEEGIMKRKDLSDGEKLDILQRLAQTPRPSQELVAEETHHRKEKIGGVLKEFNSIAWEVAQAFCGNDERVLGLREDYLERKVIKAKRDSKHHAELSATALKLVEILDWYYKYHRFSITPYISSDFPYTTHTLESPTLNERELSNLVAHLKDEIPELIPIGEYHKACQQYFASRKREKETPTATITGDLILKLKLKANQGNFTGRCPDCPR